MCAPDLLVHGEVNFAVVEDTDKIMKARSNDTPISSLAARVY